MLHLVEQFLSLFQIKRIKERPFGFNALGGRALAGLPRALEGFLITSTHGWELRHRSCFNEHRPRALALRRSC